MRSLLLILLAASSCFAQLRYERAIDWNIPDSAQKLLEESHLLEKYDLSDRVNPFYLRGDFDGDGKPDYAVLIANKKSKKSAIAICLSSRNGVAVLGADGTKVRAGTSREGYDLADFDWMDAWQVHARIKLAQNELNVAGTISQMTGEGLLVEKTEAASALVYWDGRRFRWYQLSD
jgi:hypothetical protein